MSGIVARYDRDAADYARYWAPVLERSARRLLDYVDDVVARAAGRARILEVGSGTGTLALEVLRCWPEAELTATDAARGMLDLARRRVSQEGDRIGARVRFVDGPADTLALPDQSVDLVISTFVLQLVPDRLAALREAHRILAPGGVVAYLTWLDRDARLPFRPADEFDEAVYDLEIDEPEVDGEPYAGDVVSGRSASNELRRAGFERASAREDTLEYEWTMESYLEYKLAYDERFLISLLDDAQRSELERNARERLARLAPAEFRWHAPIVFARARRPA